MHHDITPEILAIVNLRHAEFGAALQHEPPTQRALVEKGHPLAGPYQEARAFFDTLTYASEVATRRFSYRGMYESSEYQAPELHLTWWPPQHLSDCCAFLHPGHCQWDRYVTTVANAGWPHEAGAELLPGRWKIRTQSDELNNALVELGRGREDMRFGGTFNGDGTCNSYLVDVTQKITLPRDEADDVLHLHKAIVELLQKHHHGNVLPFSNGERSLKC